MNRIPPNYEDAELVRYFDHIDLYCNERGFDGVWKIRAGVKRQTRDMLPVNYRAEGLTMIEALMNTRVVLLAAMRADDLKSDRWKWPA